LANKGHCVSEKTRKKISESHQGMKMPEGTGRKISIANKGKHYFIPKETREKMSERMMGNQRFLGMTHSKENRRKMSIARKGRTLSENGKRNISISKLKQWQNPEYRKRQLKAIIAGSHTKPNKSEKKLRRGLNHLFPGEYKYVGDGSILIGYKNPDFINVNSQKKIIELFGDYWHGEERTGRTKRQEENQRIKHFAKYGYKTLIIWESELENIKQLKEKLLKFQNVK